MTDNYKTVEDCCKLLDTFEFSKRRSGERFSKDAYLECPFVYRFLARVEEKTEKEQTSCKKKKTESDYYRCSQEGHCRPRAARLERVSTLQGVRIIEAVDACECSSDSSCKRESYTHLIHSGTPYQVVIDVGVCIGHCGKDLGCKPVRNNTVSVKGPNGDEVYPVIERCSCVGNCHRMDHMETVLDFSEVEIKEGTNTTDVKPVVRQINVGQCVGACPGNETETCLLRDKREPSRCLAGLYSKQHTCTPARFKVHEYRTRRGSKREVIQIIQCICV
ncbi:hypothetical protein V1477_007060 [Vespula maculifrons]|uniref:Uncharacterized protein n=1 Tax=Vespula maculifrons TaxID=7453 RepID=A0ABD2CHF7_VESMC